MRSDIATVEEYAVELEIMLDLRCKECGSFYSASDDIRSGEGEAPYGKWAQRHAVAARKAGWFVRASKSLRELPGCLCPDCSEQRGLVVRHDEKEA